MFILLSLVGPDREGAAVGETEGQALGGGLRETHVLATDHAPELEALAGRVHEPPS
jgi:hypothetical protein